MKVSSHVYAALLLNALFVNGRPHTIDVAAYASLHADLPKLIEVSTD